MKEQGKQETFIHDGEFFHGTAFETLREALILAPLPAFGKGLGARALYSIQLKRAINK